MIDSNEPKALVNHELGGKELGLLLGLEIEISDRHEFKTLYSNTFEKLDSYEFYMLNNYEFRTLDTQ